MGRHSIDYTSDADGSIAPPSDPFPGTSPAPGPETAPAPDPEITPSEPAPFAPEESRDGAIPNGGIWRAAGEEVL